MNPTAQEYEHNQDGKDRAQNAFTSNAFNRFLNQGCLLKHQAERYLRILFLIGIQFVEYTMRYFDRVGIAIFEQIQNHARIAVCSRDRGFGHKRRHRASGNSGQPLRHIGCELVSIIFE